ncbi:MAG TPA: META domain-containing protein [bacterium]|nr:META domain-containing protein [bacterium]
MGKKALIITSSLILVVAIAAGWWFLNYSPSAKELKLVKAVNREMSGEATKNLPVGGEETITGNWQLFSLVKDGQLTDLSSYNGQISFDNNLFSGKICNNLNGKVNLVEGSSIVADGLISSTKMACEWELMDVENILLSGLNKGIGYGVANDVLTLTASNGEVIGFTRIK